ncbi:MAG: DUF6789 family protein, partial [Thermomicrobiales bacterium]
SIMAMREVTGLHEAPKKEDRRADWIADSVLSGFVATFAMTVVIAAAYGLTRAIGVADGATIERWFWALSHNPVTDSTRDGIALAIALNLIMGLIWACVYGYLVEPRLDGPGWKKGILFSLVPWALSVIAFLPIMGGGFLGAGIDAGPLPVLGNLILHLVYGAVLGQLYAVDVEAWLDGSEADRAHAEAAERGAIYGVGVGIVVGAVIGWLIGPQIDELGSRGMVTLAGALTGSAMGALLGSFLGMERAASPRPSSRA